MGEPRLQLSDDVMFQAAMGPHEGDGHGNNYVPSGELFWMQTKLQEYKEMAALACHKIDLLAELGPSQDLHEHVKMMKADKDELIRNPAKRHEIYHNMCVLFSLNKG